MWRPRFKPFLAVAGVSAAILLATGLTACSDSARDVKFTAWPAGFEGCVMAKLEPASDRAVIAVRCPNSTTTTTWPEGKSGSHSATVIDGNLPKQSASIPALPRESIQLNGQPCDVCSLTRSQGGDWNVSIPESQVQPNPYAPPRAVRQLIDEGRHD